MASKIEQLNRINLATKRVNLGDLLQTLITNLNALNAKLDADSGVNGTNYASTLNVASIDGAPFTSLGGQVIDLNTSTGTSPLGVAKGGTGLSTLAQYTVPVVNTADTVSALAVAASRVLGRKASGGVAAMTAAETKAVLALDNVANVDQLPRTLEVVVDATAAVALDATYNGRMVVTTSGSAVTLTVEDDLPVGWHCWVWQKGAGAASVARQTADTINGATSPVAVGGQRKLALVFRDVDDNTEVAAL